LPVSVAGTGPPRYKVQSATVRGVLWWGPVGRRGRTTMRGTAIRR